MIKILLSSLLLLSSSAFALGKKPVVINGVSYQCLRFAQNTLIDNYMDLEPDPVAVSEYRIFIKAGPMEAWKPKGVSNIEVFVWCDGVDCSTVITVNDAGACRIQEVVDHPYDQQTLSK